MTSRGYPIGKTRNAGKSTLRGRVGCRVIIDLGCSGRRVASAGGINRTPHGMDILMDADLETQFIQDASSIPIISTP